MKPHGCYQPDKDDLTEPPITSSNPFAEAFLARAKEIHSEGTMNMKGMIFALLKKHKLTTMIAAEPANHMVWPCDNPECVVANAFADELIDRLSDFPLQKLIDYPRF